MSRQFRGVFSPDKFLDITVDYKMKNQSFENNLIFPFRTSGNYFSEFIVSVF